MGTGRLLTPLGCKVTEGTAAVIYGSESDKTQHWYVTPVSKDSLDSDLYYKITNYSASDLALTCNSSANKQFIIFITVKFTTYPALEHTFSSSLRSFLQKKIAIY